MFHMKLIFYQALTYFHGEILFQRIEVFFCPYLSQCTKILKLNSFKIKYNVSFWRKKLLPGDMKD